MPVDLPPTERIMSFPFLSHYPTLASPSFISLPVAIGKFSLSKYINYLIKGTSIWGFYISLFSLFHSFPPSLLLYVFLLLSCRGEFWLGNDHIHLLTKAKDMTLRIELEDFEGVREYAKYDQFYVANEFLLYRLSVSGYRYNYIIDYVTACMCESNIHKGELQHVYIDVSL